MATFTVAFAPTNRSTNAFQPSRAGQPLQPGVEDEQGHQGQPEDRRGNPNQGEDASHLVDPGVAPDRRDDAKRDADPLPGLPRPQPVV